MNANQLYQNTLVIHKQIGNPHTWSLRNLGLICIKAGIDNLRVCLYIPQISKFIISKAYFKH